MITKKPMPNGKQKILKIANAVDISSKRKEAAPTLHAR
jgi:hypothetical protein